MATCTECDFDEIDTEDLEDGDTLSCPECGAPLKVRGGEVEVADEDDEDDDDDDIVEEEEDDEDDEDDEEEKDEEE